MLLIDYLTNIIPSRPRKGYVNFVMERYETSPPGWHKYVNSISKVSSTILLGDSEYIIGELKKFESEHKCLLDLLK